MMKKLNWFKHILNKIIARELTTPSSGEVEVAEKNYRKLRKVLWLTMLSLAVVPMLITAVISYRHYIDLLQVEEQAQAEWRLDGSVKTLDAMIGNVKSVVKFIAHSEKYSKLTAASGAEDLFREITKEYSFVADIGVIDGAGVQKSYAGPYALLGENYSNEKWFEEVLASGLYISPVYLGHRNIPHFAIAATNLDHQDAGHRWILRLTINATTLAEIVSTIKTKESEDLFLVTEEGFLQTPSTLFGPPLSSYNTDTLFTGEGRSNDRYRNILYVQKKVANTPWSLVLVVKKYFADEQWQIFLNRLFITLGLCFVVIIFFVYGLVHLIKTLIRRADEIQLKLLAEAEHTDKLATIGRLAAGVGHEINNPLAIINQKNGLAEDLLLMSSDFEHKPALLDCFKSINQSIDRCKAITHRLLGFARRDESEMEEVQVNDVIFDVLSFLKNSIVYNNIKLEKKLESDLPKTIGNHMQLQQVFLNIINNAIDAIGKDGNIEIVSELAVDEIKIVIKDSGIGISKESLVHIFDPFFTTKEAGKGTGLGLSITYGLVKKMGGDIAVSSKHMVGTSFIITLPIINSENDDKRKN